MKTKRSLSSGLVCIVSLCCIALSHADTTNEVQSKSTDAWAVFGPPPDSTFDWIQLDSGEWLKGDLKVMYDQSLEFDSDKLDLQDFDFEDVIKIRTRNVQRVLVQHDRDTQILTGVLEMNGDQFILRNNGDQQQLERNDVVAIAQRAKHERDRWSGSLSIGCNLRGGNSETVDATVMGNLKRQTAKTRYNLDYLANYSGTRSEETANNQRLSVDANLFLNSRLFWRMLEGELYRDVFGNIDQQYSLHSGVGYYLARSSRTEWSLGVGVGYQYTQYISVEAGNPNYSSSPYMGCGTVFDYEVTKDIDYLLDYSFKLLNEANGQYTHHLLTTLSMDLIGELDVDVSLVWDRVEKPTADSSGTFPEQDDYQVIFSLAYEF